MKADTVSTQNVVGYLAGSDSELKDEFIVIGAHYDHWGWEEKYQVAKKRIQ